MNKAEKMKKVTIINRTDIDTLKFEEILACLLKGQEYPNFYLVCQTQNHDGLTITNLDKPVIIITVKNLSQFVTTLRHELIHLRQHSKGYSNEDEAYAAEDDAEIIVTDRHGIGSN
jgi:Zn-dependent peptidase ImmA (M78 family)